MDPNQDRPADGTTASAEQGSAAPEQPRGGQDQRSGAAEARGGTADAAGDPELEKKVIAVLETCFDPEIPVNIYELGLIYEIKTNKDGLAHVKMTLTSPMCPVAGTLPPEVERKIKAIPEAKDVRVELVWDPPWEPSKMTEAARLQLNMF